MPKKSLKQTFDELDLVIEELNENIKFQLKSDMCDPMYVKTQIFKRRMKLHSIEMKIWARMKKNG